MKRRQAKKLVKMLIKTRFIKFINKNFVRGRYWNTCKMAAHKQIVKP